MRACALSTEYAQKGRRYGGWWIRRELVSRLCKPVIREWPTTWAGWMAALAESQIFSLSSPPSNGFINFMENFSVSWVSSGLCTFKAHNWPEKEEILKQLSTYMESVLHISWLCVQPFDLKFLFPYTKFSTTIFVLSGFGAKTILSHWLVVTLGLNVW